MFNEKYPVTPYSHNGPNCLRRGNRAVKSSNSLFEVPGLGRGHSAGTCQIFGRAMSQVGSYSLCQIATKQKKKNTSVITAFIIWNKLYKLRLYLLFACAGRFGWGRSGTGEIADSHLSQVLITRYTTRCSKRELNPTHSKPLFFHWNTTTTHAWSSFCLADWSTMIVEVEAFPLSFLV